MDNGPVERAGRRPPSWILAGPTRGRADCGLAVIFQAVGFGRVESCPTQAVLPLVGLAADQAIRDRHS
ncbi:MAG: hypothetical protein ACQESR_08940 [Planctomycetota bacterium]